MTEILKKHTEEAAQEEAEPSSTNTGNNNRANETSSDMSEKDRQRIEKMCGSDKQEVDDSYVKYIQENNDSALKTDIRTIVGVTLGSLLAAFNLAVFVNAANLVPGGFNGASLLIQRIVLKFLGISIPFAPLSLMFNVIPAAFAFKIIGKKYTLFSFYSILIVSFATDIIPQIYVTDNHLLLAVFGGILSGTASALVLNSRASQGGTDFIAMCFSVKKGINTFNYVMFGNIMMLVISGLIFGMESALYTIIYQFVATQMLNYLYRRYEKKTLFIVTEHPNEIAEEIRRVSNHSCTILKGEGGYSGHTVEMVYTIISTEQLSLVKRHIVNIDKNAFINVMNSANIEGRFYMRPFH